MLKKEKIKIFQALHELEFLMLCWDKEIQNNPLSKNIKDSVKLRLEGNVVFKNKEHNPWIHEKILELYSKSIAFAPIDSEELAMAYGNRSALLFHLKKYEECIEDINQALSISAVKDIYKIKYMIRKLQCFVALEKSEAKKLFEEAKTFLETAKGIENNLIEENLNKLNNVINSKSNSFEKTKKIEEKEVINFTPGKEASNISEKVSINYDPKFGMHLVANCDIPPGDIICELDSYVIFPKLGYTYSYCSNCYKFSWRNIPCDKCAQATYCSINCKENAWKSYHDIECNIIHRIWKQQDILNPHIVMSLRILILALKEAGSFKNLEKMIEEIDNWKDNRTKGFSEDHTIYKINFRSFYITNFDEKKFNENETTDIVNESAITINLLLKYTNFFNETINHKKHLTENEVVLFTGALLTRIRYIINSNGQCITNMKMQRIEKEIVDTENTSTGLYISTISSLFNLSCDPDVNRVKVPDGKTFMFSVKPIKKGKQILDMAGKPYYEATRAYYDNTVQFTEFRGSRKHFNQLCDPCQKKWLLPDSGKWEDLDFYPHVSPDEIQSTWDAIYSCPQDQKDLKALKKVKKALNLIYKNCESPNFMQVYLMKYFIGLFKTNYSNEYDDDDKEKC